MRTVIGIIAGILYIMAIVSFIGASSSHGTNSFGYAGSFCVFGFAALLSGVICIMDRLDDLIEEQRNSNDIMESTVIKILKKQLGEDIKEENTGADEDNKDEQ